MKIQIGHRAGPPYTILHKGIGQQSALITHCTWCLHLHIMQTPHHKSEEGRELHHGGVPRFSTAVTQEERLVCNNSQSAEQTYNHMESKLFQLQ